MRHGAYYSFLRPAIKSLLFLYVDAVILAYGCRFLLHKVCALGIYCSRVNVYVPRKKFLRLHLLVLYFVDDEHMLSFVRPKHTPFLRGTHLKRCEIDTNTPIVKEENQVFARENSG